MGDVGGELLNAARALWRGPASVRLALLCLAVGIGMNAAAFSVVDAVLLSPLPFAEGERLVTLSVEDAARGVTAGPLSWAELNAARSVDAVDAAEAYVQRSFTVRGPERAERVSGAGVTPGLFPLLGVDPIVGRSFGPREGAEPGFEQALLIGEGFWRRHFGGDPGVVGRTLEVNDRAIEIVGVMPAGLHFPSDQQVWLPLGTDDQADARRRYLSVIGRLAPGATLDGARAQLLPLAGRLEATELAAGSRVVRPRSLRDAFVPPAARRFLPLMLAGVGLLLLVACANVANLLLTRSLDRDREMAVRAALGASRSRLGRQLLAETGLLSGAGALLGLGIAWSWLWAIEARLPDDLPYWVEPGLSGRATFFVLGVTVLAALLSGAVPLVRLFRSRPALRLRSRAGADRDPATLRGALVAGEIALCLVLLVGAGLLARSFIALTSEDIGFPDEGVASFRLVLAGDAYDFPERRLRFYDEVTRRVAELPDVVAAVATTAIPAEDGGPSLDVAPAGAPGRPVAATLVGSSAGFFDALGIPLLAGRSWTAGEAGDTAASVAVLGESLAARLWPAGDATTREIEVEGMGRLRVIGVASDLRYETVGSASPVAGLQLHLPIGRTPGRGMAILAVTRTETAPVEAFRREVNAADPAQAPFDIRTLPARRGDSSAVQRLFASLFAEFGLMALVLALAGVYGTMAYDVRRRHHELGVRMALGATAGRIMRRVLLRSVAMTTLGIGAGMVGVAVGNRFLRGLLYGVDEYDPAVLGSVAAALLVTAVLAALLPARRATRIQPVDVLRSE